jgi:serine/threonine protein kinase
MADNRRASTNDLLGNYARRSWTLRSQRELSLDSDIARLPGPSDVDPIDATTMPQAAIAAWNRKFSSRIVEVAKNQPALFVSGRRLGGGGIGVVHETTLDGITIAVKRTYTRRLTDHQWNEIRVLDQISERRHEHIVQLIGSYVHQQRNGYELGILLWPVAQMDLAACLQDTDYLRAWLKAPSETPGHDDFTTVVDNLDTLVGPSLKLSTANSYIEHYTLHETAMRYLGQSIGCIAKAIAWLHNHGIRHKDIKPAQILLSSNGLWLTDFGWSRDVSDLTDSATSGGDIITVKYHAPERAAKERCGKAEDVFALGCVFLEIGTRLLSGVVMSPFPELPDLDLPWAQKNWSFHANLEQIDTWVQPFSTDGDHRLRLLGALIARMMSFNPQDRPGIDSIVRHLAGDYFHGSRGAGLLANFFHDCCAPSWDTHEQLDRRHSDYDEYPHRLLNGEPDPRWGELGLPAPVGLDAHYFVSDSQPSLHAIMPDEDSQPKHTHANSSEDEERDLQSLHVPEDDAVWELLAINGEQQSSVDQVDILHCEWCDEHFVGKFRARELAVHIAQQHVHKESEHVHKAFEDVRKEHEDMHTKPVETTKDYPCTFIGCHSSFRRVDALVAHQRRRHLVPS